MLKVGFADNYTAQVRQTLAYLAAWGLFVTLGALLTNHTFVIPGLLTGWLGSVIYFLLMCRRVKKSAEMSPGQAVVSMRVGWIVRFSFLVFILVLSIHVPGLNFWAAVVGLFSLHIILMFNAVVIVVSGLIPSVGKSKNNSGKE